MSRNSSEASLGAVPYLLVIIGLALAGAIVYLSMTMGAGADTTTASNEAKRVHQKLAETTVTTQIDSLSERVSSPDLSLAKASGLKELSYTPNFKVRFKTPPEPVKEKEPVTPPDDGTGDSKQPTEMTAVLNAPTNFVAKPYDTGLTMYLFWDAPELSDNEAEPSDMAYALFRADANEQGEAGRYTLLSAPIADPEYIDTSVEPGERYFYAVAAVSASEDEIKAEGKMSVSGHQVGPETTLESATGVSDIDSVEWWPLSVPTKLPTSEDYEEWGVDCAIRKWVSYEEGFGGPMVHVRVTVHLMDVPQGDPVTANQVFMSNILKGVEFEHQGLMMSGKVEVFHEGKFQLVQLETVDDKGNTVKTKAYNALNPLIVDLDSGVEFKNYASRGDKSTTFKKGDKEIKIPREQIGKMTPEDSPVPTRD